MTRLLRFFSIFFLLLMSNSAWGERTAEGDALYKKELALRESGGDYTAVNLREAPSGYSYNAMGAYQHTPSTLSGYGYTKKAQGLSPEEVAGSDRYIVDHRGDVYEWTGKDGVSSQSDYLSNKGAQESVQDQYMDDSHRYVERNCAGAGGGTYAGMAGYHLGGSNVCRVADGHCASDGAATVCDYTKRFNEKVDQVVAGEEGDDTLVGEEGDDTLANADEIKPVGTNIGKTMNFDDCLDFKLGICWGMCPCFLGSCPTPGVKFTYKEPTALVENVCNPGESYFEGMENFASGMVGGVLGKGVGQKGKCVDGLQVGGGGIIAGNSPRFFHESHVWGISPVARYASSASAMDATLSLSCGIFGMIGTALSVANLVGSMDFSSMGDFSFSDIGDSITDGLSDLGDQIADLPETVASTVEGTIGDVTSAFESIPGAVEDLGGSIEGTIGNITNDLEGTFASVSDGISNFDPGSLEGIAGGDFGSLNKIGTLAKSVGEAGQYISMAAAVTGNQALSQLGGAFSSAGQLGMLENIDFSKISEFELESLEGALNNMTLEEFGKVMNEGAPFVGMLGSATGNEELMGLAGGMMSAGPLAEKAGQIDWEKTMGDVDGFFQENFGNSAFCQSGEDCAGVSGIGEKIGGMFNRAGSGIERFFQDPAQSMGELGGGLERLASEVGATTFDQVSQIGGAVADATGTSSDADMYMFVNGHAQTVAGLFGDSAQNIADITVNSGNTAKAVAVASKGVSDPRFLCSAKAGLANQRDSLNSIEEEIVRNDFEALIPKGESFLPRGAPQTGHNACPLTQAGYVLEAAPQTLRGVKEKRINCVTVCGGSGGSFSTDCPTGNLCGKDGDEEYWVPAPGYTGSCCAQVSQFAMGDLPGSGGKAYPACQGEIPVFEEVEGRDGEIVSIKKVGTRYDPAFDHRRKLIEELTVKARSAASENAVVAEDARSQVEARISDVISSSGCTGDECGCDGSTPVGEWGTPGGGLTDGPCKGLTPGEPGFDISCADEAPNRALSGLNDVMGSLAVVDAVMRSGGLQNMAAGMAGKKMPWGLWRAYYSETDASSWRGGDPGIISMFRNAIATIGMPVCALGAMGNYLDMGDKMAIIGEDYLGCTGWGPIDPKTGWVRNKNRAIAAALAGYRGHSIALALGTVAPNTKGIQQVNLDFPHRTGCMDVGTPDPTWSEEVLNAPSIIAGGAVSLAPNTNITREGYVFTYWKRTSCCILPCGKVKRYY